MILAAICYPLQLPCTFQGAVHAQHASARCSPLLRMLPKYPENALTDASGESSRSRSCAGGELRHAAIAPAPAPRRCSWLKYMHRAPQGWGAAPPGAGRPASKGSRHRPALAAPEIASDSGAWGDRPTIVAGCGSCVARRARGCREPNRCVSHAVHVQPMLAPLAHPFAGAPPAHPCMK